MKVVLVKTERGLRGATERDQADYTKFRRRIERMKPGDYMRLESSGVRNGAHHRKMMALLQMVADNSETYDTVEKALIAVKLVAGHFEPAIHPETGELIQIPKSIAYESMDQDDFDRFYDAAIDGVLHHILPTINKATAEHMLDAIIRGWA